MGPLTLEAFCCNQVFELLWGCVGCVYKVALSNIQINRSGGERGKIYICSPQRKQSASSVPTLSSDEDRVLVTGSNQSFSLAFLLPPPSFRNLSATTSCGAFVGG
jgi:hypothetical protein